MNSSVNQVLRLAERGRLGWLAPSQEWSDGQTPLGEAPTDPPDLQEVADRLCDEGEIPDCPRCISEAGR